METIYKYPVTTTGRTAITVPGHSPQILTVAEQNGEMVAWIRFTKDEQIVSSVVIEAFGTGWEYDSRDARRHRYISTVQSGAFVWHYFQVESAW